MMYDKIKKICKEKQISVRSVEMKANLSNGAISKWNISSPSYDKIKSVADILGVSVEDLFE